MKMGKKQQFTKRELMQLYLPVIFEQSVLALTSAITVMLVARLGDDAVSGIGVVETIIGVLTYVFISASLGSNILIARNLGNQQQNAIDRTAAQAIVMGLFAGILVGVLIVFLAEPIISLFLGREENAAAAAVAVEYLQSWGYSLPLFGVFQAGQGVLRGLKRTDKAMEFAILSNLVFILVTYVFIYIIPMGVFALNLAFTLSRTFGGLLQFHCLYLKENLVCLRRMEDFRPDFGVQKELIYFGGPSSIEQLCVHGGKIVLQSLIAALGPEVLLANTICMSIINIYSIPVNSLVVAIPTVVGICLGAGENGQAVDYMKRAFKTATLIAVLICGLILLCWPLVCRLYHIDSETLSLQVRRLILLSAAFYVLFSARAYILPAGLRSGGDVFFTSGTSFTTMWLIVVGLGYILAVKFGIGITGYFIAMGIEWAAKAALFTFRLKSERWIRSEDIKKK